VGTLNDRSGRSETPILMAIALIGTKLDDLAE
jgi:hypothetical protein